MVDARRAAGVGAAAVWIFVCGILGGAPRASAAVDADKLEPRPISATERAAVELAALYLAEGGTAWQERLAPSSPWAALSPEEALREIEVRAGPPAGATWSLLTPAPGTPEDEALFSVVFPSGADDTLTLRLARTDDGQEGSGDGSWQIVALHSLSEPAPPHEETFFSPHPEATPPHKDAGFGLVSGPRRPRRPGSSSGRAFPVLSSLLGVLALLGLLALLRLARRLFRGLPLSVARGAVPIVALVLVVTGGLLALSCGSRKGSDTAPAADPSAEAEGAAGPAAAEPTVRLGGLRDIRWTLATDGDPSALGAEIAQAAPDGLQHQVADLWRAQLLLRQVDLHEAEEILGEMPDPGPVPLADLLRARLATAEGDDDDASWSYDNVQAAGPDHDGLRLETAAALATLGFERQSEVDAIQIAEMGSRVAEVWYLRAQLTLFDDRPKEGEKILRKAWTERPILREELFGDPLLATLIARPSLFPLIEPGSPEEPTVRASDLGKTPARLPTGARVTALGRLVRIEIDGHGAPQVDRGDGTGGTNATGGTERRAVIEVPGGAALAPAATRLVDAATWKRRDQEAALARLDTLTKQARGMAAYGQPRLRRQILEAASALAEDERWDELVVLTDGIENQVERVPAILGQLRALALRKTSRSADARSLLIRLAKVSMDSKRPTPAVLYQLAELLVSDREFDTALRLLRKASALSPLARNDARIEQIRLEQWLYENQLRKWSDHFEIIYPRMTGGEYAEQLGVVLEAERERIGHWVPLRAGHPIEVDLFPLERFLRAHSGGVLVLGLYDGRVRVPFADLQSLHPRLVAVLSHEVAHALLAQATYDRAPKWFQEGLAQHVEMMPGRVNPIPDLDAKGRVISFPMIEAILDGFAEPQLVDLAYGEAAWVVHYLEAVHGVKSIRAFADAYSRGLSTEQTIREVLGMSVAQFDRAVWKWCLTDAPSGWPTELVRYDRELDGLVRRSGAERELVRQARGALAQRPSGPAGSGSARPRRSRRPATMAGWYQVYAREVADFKSSLRSILGPLNQGKLPKPIACVTLSGQVNRLLQDPTALHPPDQSVEQALDAAFHDFANMAEACSRGSASAARASLGRAEQALGAAAREMKPYGIRP